MPSKLYSILAAARPLVASVDPGTEVARVVERGRARAWPSPPTTPTPSSRRSCRSLDDPDGADAMGAAGRRFVETWASPAAVARRYEELFAELRAGALTPRTGRAIPSPGHG